jgi:hypothetical protein
MDMIRSSGKTGVPDMVNGIQLANQGGMVLPGTGRVMQPMTGGKSRPTFGGGYMGKSQFKFLGMPIPFTQRNERFNDADIQRYNAQGGPNVIERQPSYVPGTTFHRTRKRQKPAVAPTTKRSSSTADAFANFGQNIQTIKDAAEKRKEMMRQMGYEPDGYVNLRGQPVNLGPQSKAITMPGTPVPRSNIQVINLPPETLPPQKAPTPVRSGTQIPEFSITSRNTHRSVVSTVLGIADLVG